MSYSPLFPVTEDYLCRILDGTFAVVLPDGRILHKEVRYDFVPDYSVLDYTNRGVECEKRRQFTRTIQNNTVWTPEKVEKLRLLRDQGLSFDEIGERIGCTGNAASTAYRDKIGHAKQLRRPLARFWTEEETAQLVHLHEVQGLTFRHIAKIMNRTKPACSRRYFEYKRGRRTVTIQAICTLKDGV